MLILSPHLDDGVLSCGQLLAKNPGATLVTALAGIPPDEHTLTEWDADTGFASAVEAMTSRRDEDQAACQVLGATPIWLDGLDEQYRRRPGHDDALARDLKYVLDTHASDEILIPLGILHHDHERVAALARRIIIELGLSRVTVYEEIPYRLQFQHERDAAIKTMTSEGWDLSDPRAIACGSQKLESLACYPSQLRALPPEHLHIHEIFWTALAVDVR